MWLSLAIDGGINIMNNALKGLQPEKVFMFLKSLHRYLMVHTTRNR